VKEAELQRAQSEALAAKGELAGWREAGRAGLRSPPESLSRNATLPMEDPATHPAAREDACIKRASEGASADARRPLPTKHRLLPTQASPMMRRPVGSPTSGYGCTALPGEQLPGSTGPSAIEMCIESIDSGMRGSAQGDLASKLAYETAEASSGYPRKSPIDAADTSYTPHAGIESIQLQQQQQQQQRKQHEDARRQRSRESPAVFYGGSPQSRHASSGPMSRAQEQQEAGIFSRASEVFDQMDVNRDGVVTRAEFKAAYVPGSPLMHHIGNISPLNGTSRSPVFTQRHTEIVQAISPPSTNGGSTILSQAHIPAWRGQGAQGHHRSEPLSPTRPGAVSRMQSSPMGILGKVQESQLASTSQPGLRSTRALEHASERSDRVNARRSPKRQEKSGVLLSTSHKPATMETHAEATTGHMSPPRARGAPPSREKRHLASTHRLQPSSTRPECDRNL